MRQTIETLKYRAESAERKRDELAAALRLLAGGAKPDCVARWKERSIDAGGRRFSYIGKLYGVAQYRKSGAPPIFIQVSKYPDQNDTVDARYMDETSVQNWREFATRVGLGPGEGEAIDAVNRALHAEPTP